MRRLPYSVYPSFLGDVPLNNYLYRGARLHWEAPLDIQSTLTRFALGNLAGLGDQYAVYQLNATAARTLANALSQGQGFTQVNVAISGFNSFSLVVELTTTVDFGSVDDALSIVAGLAYQTGFQWDNGGVIANVLQQGAPTSNNPTIQPAQTGGNPYFDRSGSQGINLSSYLPATNTLAAGLGLSAGTATIVLLLGAFVVIKALK